MNEAFFARHALDESTELLNGANHTTVGLIDFDVASNLLDFSNSAIERFLIIGKDQNATAVVFVNVDLGTGDLGDTLDVLASRTDQHTNLFGVNTHFANTRSMSAQIFVRLGLNSRHNVQNLGTSAAVLLDCFNSNR